MKQEEESEVTSRIRKTREAPMIYCLAIVDEETGDIKRLATPSETKSLARSMAKNVQKPKSKSSSLTSNKKRRKRNSKQASMAKSGGPCSHCGTSASPQWRRGPYDKPVLCNACGTRFRRTNQLAPLNSTKVYRKRISSRYEDSSKSKNRQFVVVP